MPRHQPSVKNVSKRVRKPPLHVAGNFPFIQRTNKEGLVFSFTLTTGHFTYECKSSRPYVSRPSRTAQLGNPRLLAKSSKADGPTSVDVPEEFKTKFVVFFASCCSVAGMILKGIRLLIGVGLQIGSWKQRRSKERRRRRRRIERRNGRSGMFHLPLRLVCDLAHSLPFNPLLIMGSASCQVTVQLFSVRVWVWFRLGIIVRPWL